MENTIQFLATTRKEIARLEAEIARLNESIAVSALGFQLGKAKELLTDYQKDATFYRENIDEIAFIYYKSTEDKHPHAAVTVKDGTGLEYKEADAIKWAIDTKQYHLFSIKKSPFEKIARADIQIPGVEKVQKLSTSVKQDLSEYLED